MTAWLEVVHGDPETPAEDAALTAVARRAWELGCQAVHGTNDTHRYLMPDPCAALALLAYADACASSWWRVRVVA